MFQLIPKKALLLTTMDLDYPFFAKALEDANCQTYLFDSKKKLDIFSHSLDRILEKSYEKYYKIFLLKDDPNLDQLQFLSTQIQII